MSSHAVKKDIEKDVEEAVIHQVPVPAVAHAPIANCIPLGLFALGMTSMLFGFVISGWTTAGSITQVLTSGFFYGGAAQMIAGILCLVKGQTLAGTIFCAYSSFWLATALMNWVGFADLFGKNAIAGDPTGTALYFGLWALFTICMFVPTLRTNGCLVTLLGLLSVTFILLVGGVFSTACNKAAGYLLMATCLCAFYTAVAMIWNEMLGLPMPGLSPVKLI